MYTYHALIFKFTFLTVIVLLTSIHPSSGLDLYYSKGSHYRIAVEPHICNPLKILFFELVASTLPRTFNSNPLVVFKLHRHLQRAPALHFLPLLDPALCTRTRLRVTHVTGAWKLSRISWPRGRCFFLLFCVQSEQGPKPVCLGVAMEADDFSSSLPRTVCLLGAACRDHCGSWCCWRQGQSCTAEERVRLGSGKDFAGSYIRRTFFR